MNDSVRSAPSQADSTSAAASQPVLAVKNIEVIYDHVILVLRGVSFEVPQGKIVALLGGNGAGKSTTLKSISTLLASERRGHQRFNRVPRAAHRQAGAGRPGGDGHGPVMEGGTASRT